MDVNSSNLQALREVRENGHSESKYNYWFCTDHTADDGPGWPCRWSVTRQQIHRGYYPESHPRWESAKAIGLINDTKGTEPLISALQSDNSTVRYWAAAALRQIKDPRSLDSLVVALGDCNESIRGEAGWAIRSVEGPDSTDLFVQLLAGGNTNRRMGAAEALGDSGDRRGVQPLIGVLEDTDASVRAGAAEALGLLDDGQAVTPLIKLLRDPEDKVRGQAREALVAIGKPGEESLILALKGGDNTTRAEVAAVLGAIGDEMCIDPLLLAFKNGDRNVRHAAVTALARINRSSALQPFVQILQDPNALSDMRADAAWALGELNDVKAREPLLKSMADDKDGNVRMSAAKALKIIGNVSVPMYSI